jgi:hypothetical protein
MQLILIKNTHKIEKVQETSYYTFELAFFYLANEFG